jgi:putative tricarboxylic transport membrane protein
MFNLREMAYTGWSTVRSSLVGFVVGVLPGAGATIASAMTYSMEKRLAGKTGTFGEGDIRGVAAPEAANNASAAGSFVPMLTLGVPGSGTTAVMVGALALYNITPGPALFTQNPNLVWGLIASLFVANVMLLFINIPLVGVFTRILRLPNWLLVPGILAISAVGVYSVHATTFDLLLMAGCGIVGYLLRKQGVPMAPLILGFVLGDMMEQNLRRACPSPTARCPSCWRVRSRSACGWPPARCWWCRRCCGCGAAGRAAPGRGRLSRPGVGRPRPGGLSAGPRGTA